MKKKSKIVLDEIRRILEDEKFIHLKKIQKDKLVDYLYDQYDERKNWGMTLPDFLWSIERHWDKYAEDDTLDEVYYVISHLDDNGYETQKTYYIQIERQGWTLAVIKVKAKSYQEAECKALKAWHATDDISEISKESAEQELENGSIDYIIDENGDEIDPEEEDAQEEIKKLDEASKKFKEDWGK